EDHGRRGPESDGWRRAEQLLDLLGERLAEVADLATRLEAAHDLRRRADAAVTVDERFLEPLLGFLVGGVERAGRDLGRQRTAALRARVARTPKEAGPLRLVGCGRLVTEELCPGSRHGATLPAARTQPSPVTMPAMYSLTLFVADHPRAVDFVTSSFAVMRLPRASGCMTIGEPNISAISRIENDSAAPSPNSSPSPCSPISSRPSTMSSTWVKMRCCVPGEVTGSSSPARNRWRKISISVP